MYRYVATDCTLLYLFRYRIVGKFGKFSELPMIRQNKTIQIS